MLTIKLPEELDKKLSQFAKETNRTKSECAIQAVETFLEDYEDYKKALEISERVARGEEKTISLEELERKLGLDDGDA